MKSLLSVLLLAGALHFAGLERASADTAKTYQVTGPIVELTDKTIVVQKGDERWEIARDEKARVNGDLKIGSKVTIHYRMTATTIESKTDGKTDASSAKKKAK